jgi:ribosomal protein S18 acetylase RimI-like enzyme
MKTAVRPLREGKRLRLRRFAPGDLVAVRRLWKAGGLDLGPSDTRREIVRSLARDPDLFIVAVEEGRVIGAVLGRFDGRRGWVNRLAVDPRARSRGVGSTLMREVERRLRAKGCRKVNLHVARDNRAVCAFYAELGYQRADLIFMEKWL